MPRASPKLNHQIIRHAFENVLTACARLAAFATATPTSAVEDLVNGRQLILAVDDLMHFAVNARRIMHATSTIKDCTTIQIPSVINKQKTNIAITRIVNTIIHHKDITIYRFNYDSVNPSNMMEFIDAYQNREHYPPMIVLESDQEAKIVFKLSKLVTSFEENILSKIVNVCSDDGLELEDLS